ncbi:MAG TPA: tyrosine/phenylalanine carboxypeptidase domain-containing protein [Polyangiales bacterium]
MRDSGVSRELSQVRGFEAKLALLTRAARLLPSITAPNAAVERARLIAALEAGQLPVPCFEYPRGNESAAGVRFVDRLREEAQALPVPQLYLEKLDELELDLALLAVIGDSRRVRPLSARRFGTGHERVVTPLGELTLAQYARTLVATQATSDEPRVFPPESHDGSPSLASVIRALSLRAGLDVQVCVEPNLAAGAATGDRTVYIAARLFGAREVVRLAVHEVLGHLTAAANGRAQPLRLIDWGTAGSFADQEGVALCLEDSFGLLDAGRLRSIGGRVLATELMHAGASFGECATTLLREHGFSVAESVALSERAYRGGGVARDVSYLLGFLRVQAALQSGSATLDELRMGRVSVAALPQLRQLITLGLARPAVYRPNFARSCRSTSSGTMPWRSPPSAAASLMSVELT